MKTDITSTNAAAASDSGSTEVSPSYGISIGVANRIGLDGASAYDIAVKHGFEGTEEEWANSLVNPAEEGAKKAEKAAQQAQEIADNLSVDLTWKVSLDDQKKYIVPSQVDPLTGLQTGSICTNGYYTGQGGLLTDTSAKTIELLFTTPSELTGTAYLLGTSNSTRNINAYLEGNVLNVNSVKSYIKCKDILPETTYHLVMVFGQGSASYIYLNGSQVGKGTNLTEASTSLSLGNNLAGNAPFSGIIHRLRFFSEAFSTAEVEWLWNCGRPGDIRILRQWSLGMAKKCYAEYTGWGLLPGAWRDTSDNDIHLEAVGEPEYSYILPQDMFELVRSTGLITKDIDHVKGNSYSISVPNGYIPYSMIIMNYNSNPITNFTIRCSDVDRDIIPFTSIRQGEYEDRLVWHGNMFPISMYDRMLVYAQGNTTNRGLEIVITYRWAGHVAF